MSEQEQLPYFAPLLPWQKQPWRQLTGQFIEQHLPHGLLAAGQKGIGKREFVWRFVAYLLCLQKNQHGACGHCQSCQWLRAGTHPDLLVLPQGDSIKIDDIRALQEYSQTKGHGVKVIVLDGADTLTLGAANAFLKTLEEPRDGVFLILISDHLSRLLPTIKSRVQTMPLSYIDKVEAIDYLSEFMSPELSKLLLDISDGAVLQAKGLSSAKWFDQRTLWLKTYTALQLSKRTASAASSYWQKTLALAEFITLSRVMLMDLWRVFLGIPSLHQDIDVAALLAQVQLDSSKLESLLSCIDDTQAAYAQNVQETLGFDRILIEMAK
ncbi:DNA polymerase III subunit [Moraxella catarrhalis]|uniref:DNA polymerase III subunit n=1 Tax=Moraxella catarrhalis TaxID=480 RepID=UPI0007E4B624|nr:DNA polymerase III subunit [Moraxella catarrhalis]OAV06458.1 DNA polymerase III delta prime subunit [Moraxella catarrhalis]